MVRGSEWSEEIFEVLYESIWNSFNLFPESDRTVRIRKWRDSVEASVIKWTLDALNWNMMSLGFVADNIYSENKSAIWVLFGILSQDEYYLPYHVMSNYENYMLKIYREVMRFSEKSFICILNEPEIIETMYEYDIHILIFLCISQNFNKVSYFANLYSNFKFIDYNILDTIYYLCSSIDYMPNLREFFTKSKQILADKYKVD